MVSSRNADFIFCTTYLINMNVSFQQISFYPFVCTRASDHIGLPWYFTTLTSFYCQVSGAIGRALVFLSRCPMFNHPGSRWCLVMASDLVYSCATTVYSLKAHADTAKMSPSNIEAQNLNLSLGIETIIHCICNFSLEVHTSNFLR